jgi:hypothetical protein
VTRLEAICILLAYAFSHKMKLFQMDVKSAFLNGFINEEVYVEQPPGFEDATYPNCDNPIRDNSVLSPKPLHLVIKR